MTQPDRQPSFLRTEGAPSRAIPRTVSFVFAYLLSAFGFEFLVFVLTVHVYDLTGSAWNVGVFTALTFVPRLFSPYYGSLVDRYRRDRVFIGAALAVALGALFIAAAQSIVATYAVWFVIALRWSAARAMQATAALYVAAAFLGFATKLTPISARPRRSASEVMSHLREGAEYLFSSRQLRYLGTIAFLWRLSLALQVPLFVVYVKECLGRGSAGYGLFMTAIGVGSLVGSALGPHLATHVHPQRMAFWGLVAHYGSFGLLGSTRSFLVAVGIAAASHLVFYATVVSVHALRDGATPVAYRGRVYGCITGILTPAALISILVGSSLASAVGAPAVLAGGGALGVAGLVAARLWLGPSQTRRDASRTQGLLEKDVG